MKLPLKLSNWLLRVKSALTAPTTIGALEISSTSLKYLLIKNNFITQASLRLPPGIIERGKIVNPALLTQALKNLHTQITSANKPLSVILVIPQSLVYTQSFTVPIVAQAQIVESITLNLQMISPAKIEESFYDYQEVQERPDAGQIELLGAFANRTIITSFTEAVKAAGFITVAVEFPALALASLIRLRWGGISATEDYLVLYVSSEGLMSLILKNGNLAFNRFTPWHEISKELSAVDTLTFTQMKDFVAQDLQRVLNFYVGRTGRQMKNAILISPVFNYELITLVQEKLGITMHNLAIAELPKLQAGWLSVLGAGLRATVTRNKDLEISLTAENAQTEYLEERIINFVALWRNIIAGALILVLGAFAFMNHAFMQQQTQLTDRLRVAFDASTLQSYKAVQEKVKTFNETIVIIDKIRQKERAWSPVISAFKNAAGNDIQIKKLVVDANLNFTMNGNAKTDTLALAFKDRLTALPFIKSANLPLSQVTREGDSSVFFDNLRGALTALPSSTPKNF